MDKKELERIKQELIKSGRRDVSHALDLLDSKGKLDTIPLEEFKEIDSGSPEVACLFLKHKNSEVRVEAITKLKEFGEEALKHRDEVAGLLSDDDFNVRFAVIIALQPLGFRTDEIISLLQQGLNSSELKQRVVSTENLGLASLQLSLAKRVAPLMKELIVDKEEEVRVHALASLIDDLPPREELIEQCIAALDDKAEVVVNCALEVLCELGEKGKESVPKLIKLLQVPANATYACTALGLMKNHAEDAVPLLKEKLYDEDWDLRYSAAEALGRIGKQASIATDTLSEVVQSKELVTKAAVEALSKVALEPEKTVEPLIKALGHDDLSVSTGSARALGDLKDLAKPCLLYTSPSPRDATLSRMPSSA